MTNDYKENILKYVTNDITETSGSNVPSFSTTTTINDSISNMIRTALGTTYVYGGYIYDQTTQNILIYGYTSESGFMYLVDKDLNELALITELSSGSKLFRLYTLNVDETGNLYGISNDTDETKRVLLFNNVFVKNQAGNYQLVLRQSYIIPNGANYRFKARSLLWSQKVRNLIKSPNEATYFISLDNRTTLTTTIVRFTINVGMENEWVFKDLDQNSYMSDMLIEESGDGNTLYFFSESNLTDTTTVYKYTIKDDEIISKVGVDVGVEVELIVAITPNETYVGGYDEYFTTAGLFKICNNVVKTIETFSSPYDVVNISLTNDIICLKKGNTLTLNADAQVGILQNDTPYYSTTYQAPSSITTFFIMKSYNLLVFYLTTGTSGNETTTKFILDYNPLNYNGVAYSGYNQTLAVKGRLYSNGEMVFARNLYNTTLLGNIATSNLQVPNTLLNDETIIIQDLVGATNGILINNNTAITKNIYETLYVNFIRSLNVLDEDTNTTYPNAASYVNQNINTATKQNCENSFVGKVRINYENSTIMQNINWNYVTDHYETSFVVDATDEVPTIDYMSNDETTVYISKELDINVGSYYLVSQKLRIE